MTIITNALAVAALILSSASFALGSVDPAPPVNAETIKGLWEALSDSDTRVFRLELVGDTGWLAIGIPHIEPMIFALTQTRWQKGRVELYFKGVGRSSYGRDGPGDATPYSAVLRLRGVAWSDGTRGSGVLEGVFVLSPEKKPENVWKVRFVKQTELPYLETISKLAVEAKQAIEREKQDRK